jgi:hypothetical protein
MPRSKFRTIYDKTTLNLIDVFVEEEYAAFPVATHDDMLDMLARILDEDMKTKWPAPSGAMQQERQRYANVGYSDLKKRWRHE